MKLRLGLVSAVLAGALLTGAAWGYPTRFGPVTGLVDLPTPDVIATNDAEIAADFTRLEGGQDIYPARLLLGVSEGGEIGIGYAKLHDGVDGNVTSFAGKMSLMHEPASDLGLAVGGAWLDGPDRDLLDVYVVASKEFPKAAAGTSPYRETSRARMRGHLGLMFTRIGDGARDNEFKPFLGFDVTTPEGTSFVAEYKWTEFGRDHAAAAIRYPVSPKVTIQAGVARAGSVLAQDDYRCIVGFSYDLAPAARADTAY